MKALQLIAVGEDTGLVLPVELLGRLGWQAGDTLLCQMSPDGATVELQRLDADAVEQLTVGRELLRRHAAVLRALGPDD